MPANSLKILKLKPSGFQFIQELPIAAPPQKVWKILLDMGRWFRFDGTPDARKVLVDARVGGHYLAEMPDGTTWLHMTFTCIEPNRVLRASGPMGMSHLPLNNAFIFELQPTKTGTLLRFCQRTYGWLTPGMEKNYQGGWNVLLPNIKTIAEGTLKIKKKSSARTK